MSPGTTRPAADGARKRPAGRARQLMWFVALWCLSVAALGVVSLAIRWVLFA